MREKLMQWLSDLTPAAEQASEEASLGPESFGLDMAPPPETLARAAKREVEAISAPPVSDSMDALRRQADRP